MKNQECTKPLNGGRGDTPPPLEKNPLFLLIFILYSVPSKAVTFCCLYPPPSILFIQCYWMRGGIFPLTIFKKKSILIILYTSLEVHIVSTSVVIFFKEISTFGVVSLEIKGKINNGYSFMFLEYGDFYFRKLFLIMFLILFA